jgi:Ca2+-binding EF-hand superfamily protein
MSRTAKTTAQPAQAAKPAPSASWKDRITAEDFEELKNTFDIFDEDGSGTIDPEEISKVLEELGLDKRNPFILTLILGLKEKNKPIAFPEFLDIICSKVGETKTKDGIRRVFAIFDKDENGIIDFEEFKAISKQLHENLNDDDLLELMHNASINSRTSSNEGFTFEEFYAIVAKFNK